MVVRKSSGPLPYTTSPNSPAPDINPKLSSPSSLQQSSSVEQLHRQHSHLTYPSPLEPWADGALNKSLPAILTPTSAQLRSLYRKTSQEARDGLRTPEANEDSPRTDVDSQRSPNFWDNDPDPIGDGSAATTNSNVQRLQVQTQTPYTGELGPADVRPRLAPTSVVKRKPVGGYEARNPSYDSTVSENYGEFASNNPFRKVGPDGSTGGSQTSGTNPNISNGFARASVGSVGKEKAINDDLDDTSLHMSANLSIDDRPFAEFSSSYRPSNIDLGSQFGSNASQAGSQTGLTPSPARLSGPLPPPPAHAPPPPPIPAAQVAVQTAPQEEHAPLIPLPEGTQTEYNPWLSGEKASSPPVSPVAHQAPVVSTSRPQFEEPVLTPGQTTGVVSLDQESPLITLDDEPRPQANRDTEARDESQKPPLPTRPQARGSGNGTEEVYAPPGGPPPPKPPRPSVSTQPVDAAALSRLNSQRTETYQIKHFNWYDHSTGQLRRSSMLTQNQNGPCPLLALVNALIFGKSEDSALGNALRAREQVSLGLLIESLMDELTSEGRGGTLHQLPDVDQLNAFLLRLHTGMNANPRFISPDAPAPNLMYARNSGLNLPPSINTDRTPGTFEQTQDIQLYGAFSIPLLHGWLPSRNDPARAAFARSAPTYEDAQTIQFGEEELEGKLSQGGLTPDEQQLLHDIVTIKTFLNAFPTQLTPYGLDVINETLFPGSFAIMFRNDHFSTVYKHPQSGQLFTLVTDAGYSDRDEIIWESLVDISGRQSEFFSGDFRPVGNNEPSTEGSAAATGMLSSGQGQSSQAINGLGPTSPTSPQEQHDADFAMALQLQQEEDARASTSSHGRERSTSPRRRTGTSRLSLSGEGQDRPSTSNANPNIPIRLRTSQESRPSIPPRNQRNQNQGVNRPTPAPTSLDDAPPPLYEEAVKGTPYLPPPGHPQHPGSNPSLSPQTSSPNLLSNPLQLPSPNPPANIVRPTRRGAPGPQQRQGAGSRTSSAYLDTARQHQYNQRPESLRNPLASPDLGLGQERYTGMPGEYGRREDRDCVVM